MSSADFKAAATRIVGAAHVLTHPNETRRYRNGFRFGGGGDFLDVGERQVWFGLHGYFLIVDV